jgi:O-antigen/teichoic acid export membrane protein
MSKSSSTQASRSIGRTIVRNTAVGVIGQFLLKIASFIFQIAVINNLGDENWGRYNIVLGWASLFGVLGDLGISQYLTREIARDRRNASQLFWNAVVLRFILAVITSIVTTISAIAIGYSQEIVIACLLFTLSYLFQALLAPMMSLVAGHERVDLTASVTMVTQILFMVFGGAALLLGLGFQWVVLANVVNIPFVLFLMFWLVRRNNLGPPAFKITPSDWWSLVRASLPFGAMQLSLSFAYRMDTIILSRTYIDEVVGWYNAAYGLTLTLLTLSRAYNDAVLPSLTRANVLDASTASTWYFGSVRAMAFLCLPICIGGTLMAPQIVSALYQPEYAPAAVALAILIWDIPFNLYHQFGGTVGNSIKAEHKVSQVFVLLSILNFVLNLVLIPSLSLIGASIATVLTDVFGAAVFYFMFRYRFGAGLQFRRLVRLLAAALGMGVVVVLLLNWKPLDQLGEWGHLSIIVGFSAVSYLVMVWFSGAFSTAERQRFMQVFARARRSANS